MTENIELTNEVEYLKSKRVIKRDNEIAEKTGYAKSVISNYLSGRIPASKKFMQKFHEVYKEALIENKVFDKERKKGNIIFVPLYAYGGFLNGYAKKVFVDSLEHFYLPGIQGEHFAFEVEGYSMFDKFKPGDWAISQPLEKVEWMVKGRFYVLQTTDGILIKTFEAIKGDKALFKCFNAEYADVTLPLRSIEKVYYVVKNLNNL